MANVRHRVNENLLVIGTLVLFVYLILPPGFESWKRASGLDQLKEQTVSAATVVEVWIYKKTAQYYCPDSKLYGKFKPGMYMMQDDALERGYRPAAQEPCR
jgi:hypothetical protein